MDYYTKALKQGKKCYQSRVSKGEKPTLPVLDEILPSRGDYTEIPLGRVQIPLDQVVGTKTGGRSGAFAGNFMPLLDLGTEFAFKWNNLCISHEEEGIRDPIKAYEYMNKFYVLEGNKRVSVLKFFDAVSVAGDVIRIKPKKTDTKESRIYYEFLDFYEKTGLNEVWFSDPGGFRKLQRCIIGQDREWTEQERKDFRGAFSYFKEVFYAVGGGEMNLTPADAFLTFLVIYPYEEIRDLTPKQLKDLVKAGWEEFRVESREEKIDLEIESTDMRISLIDKLFTGSHTEKVKIAFLYEKNPMTSGTTYSHEMGRLHLEQMFPEEVETLRYDDVTAETAKETIDRAIKEKCEVIFTTSPRFMQASLRAAVENPKVHILNCSLLSTHKSVRTYYARLSDVKFLMGILGGILSENNRLLYVASYPTYGALSNINAFALGVKMVNPKAKVHLAWRFQKGFDPDARIRECQPDYICGRNVVVPGGGIKSYGLYRVSGEEVETVAIPLYHWGKFYEKLVRTVIAGSYEVKEKKEEKAINYWWGMKSDMTDLLYSTRIPAEVKKLLELLKRDIVEGTFHPFEGALYSQHGLVQGDGSQVMAPKEQALMTWLASNVEGCIPEREEFVDEVQDILEELGVFGKTEA